MTQEPVVVPPRSLEDLERDCLVLISEIASLRAAAARGSLDARRAQRIKLRALDQKLDDYNFLKEFAQ